MKDLFKIENENVMDFSVQLSNVTMTNSTGTYNLPDEVIFLLKDITPDNIQNGCISIALSKESAIDLAVKLIQMAK